MEERVTIESGQTQTGPQTAACLLLVWTALLKGPVSLFQTVEPGEKKLWWEEEQA